MFLGKRQYRLDEFFDVEGDRPRRRWRSAATPAASSGSAAACPEGGSPIAGNAGMHLGAFMKGGTIEVSGDASDWVGAK